MKPFIEPRSLAKVQLALASKDMTLPISLTRSRQPRSAEKAGPWSEPFDKRKRPWSYILLGLPLCILSPGSAKAFDVTCRKGQAVLRIEVVTEDDKRGLPCDVIIWSTPTQQRRLWRAEFEAGFCEAKAQAKVNTLVNDDQWRCHATDPPAPSHGLTGRHPVM